MDKTVEKNFNCVVFNPPCPKIDEELQYKAVLKLADITCQYY